MKYALRKYSRHCLAAAALTATACDRTLPPDPTDTFDLSCTVSTDQLFFGGVARDGIPALTAPEFVTAGAADFIEDNARVLGIVVDGEARAYPMAMLWWHEVVNDFLGDRAILVTYCPLTGSGLAFDPLIDGVVRNFGVSGILFENNLIMFDRQTETLWNQLSLGAICGAERGDPLPRLPIVESTWGHWKTLYPQTTIITPNTGFDDLPYGLYPYGNYAELSNPTTLFPSSEWSDARPPKELVLGVQDGSDAVAYPFGELEDMGEVVALNEQINQRPFLVTYKTSDHTAIAFDRVVEGDTLTFSVVDTALVRYQDVETGSVWNRRGEAIEGELTGTQLEQLADAYAVYWFSWSVYFPETVLFLNE